MAAGPIVFRKDHLGENLSLCGITASDGFMCGLPAVEWFVLGTPRGACVHHIQDFKNRQCHGPMSREEADVFVVMEL